MPDWAGVNVDLVLDREAESGVLGRFTWEKYLEASGTLPCSDSALFKHVDYMDQTVLERLCAPGKHLFVNTENGARVAQIEVSCNDSIFIEYLDRSCEREWITVDNIITNANDIENAKRILCIDKRRSWKFIDPLELIQYRNSFNKKLSELIQRGQYFEMQDASEPRIVLCCKVLENYNGIVMYECQEKVMVVHLCEPRCHAMGWALLGAQKVNYSARFSEKMVENYNLNPVPSIIFESTKVSEHNMQVGVLVEVLDIATGAGFFPGHVCEIINEHYFKVSTSSSADDEIHELVFHRGSPGIFPVGFCASMLYVLSKPKRMANRVVLPEEDDKWSWTIYKDEWGIEGVPSTEAHFDSVIIKHKIPAMQHVELFCYQQGTMCAGVITRSLRNHVFVVPTCDGTLRSIMLNHNSTAIFPCGFAEKYNLPFIEDPPFHTLPVLKNLKAARFDILQREYSSIPGPVFRQRTKNDKAFMSAVWLCGDLWLPRLYVRRSCRYGPMMDPKLFSGFRDYYDAGPLPHIIKLIVKDLFHCVYVKLRPEVEAMLDSGDADTPCVIVKYKWRAEHHIMRVAACESASQMAGWLKVLLRCLGCCPNLISFDSSTPCTYACHAKVIENDAFFEVETTDKDKDSSRGSNVVSAEKRLARQLRKESLKTTSLSKRRRGNFVEDKANISTSNIFTPPKQNDFYMDSNNLSDDDDSNSRPSLDEMPRLERNQPVGINGPVSAGRIPVNGTNGCINSRIRTHITPPGPLRLSGENTLLSPSRPIPLIRLGGDPMEWNQDQLRRFLISTFPDLGDVIDVLYRENIDGAQLLSFSEQDCIDSLGLLLGPALRLFEVIQAIQSAHDEHFG